MHLPRYLVTQMLCQGAVKAAAPWSQDPMQGLSVQALAARAHPITQPGAGQLGVTREAQPWASGTSLDQGTGP